MINRKNLVAIGILTVILSVTCYLIVYFLTKQKTGQKSQIPPPLSITTPAVVPTSTPTFTPTQIRRQFKVFTCLDPLVAQPAPCTQVGNNTCINIQNGEVFRCSDAPRL